jgi:hypothetical protein
MIPDALADELGDDGDLDANNDLEYLLGLAGDAAEHDGFEDDFERAAWTVAQWCQELQYEPDLRSYETGQCVPKDAVPEDRETAELREWTEEHQQ